MKNNFSLFSSNWGAFLFLFFALCLGQPLAAQVSITASASCTGAAGVAATENTYFIEVTNVTNPTGALPTTFQVSIAGVTLTFDPANPSPLIFGPYSHSGVGGAVQVVEALDVANGGPLGFEEVPEILCGVRPDGGQASGGFCMLTTDPSVPSGAILAQSAPGTFMAGGTSGQVQAYVLVDAAGFIVQSNLTGLFTGLPSDVFQVYAVNYRDTEPLDEFLIPGEAFAPVLDGVNATQGDSPLDGACYTVCNTDPPITVPVNCMSIGSTVFTDLDDDAMFEPGAGELGIGGITVQLYTASLAGTPDVLVGTTTTTPAGDYFFGGLPEGMYIVVIPSTPTGFPLSSTDPVAPTDATGDDMDSGIQLLPGGSVSSPVITLTAQTEPVGPDEAGQGSTQDDNVVTATSTSDDDANGDMTVDFGFAPAMSLGSTVFYDVDNSGDQDLANPLEGGIAGITVELYAAGDVPGTDTPIASTMTDAEGNYLFENLPPGSYLVAAVAGTEAPISSTGAAVSTDPNDDVDGNSDGSATTTAGQYASSGTVTLTYNMEPGMAAETFQGGSQDDADDINGNMTVDFGFVPTGSVGSTVFYDMNDDGIQAGPSEVGIPGVTVQLFADLDNNGSAETLVGTTTTDNEGNYFFGNLPDGDYQLVIPTAPGGAELSSTTTPTGEGNDNGIQGAAGAPTTSPVFTLTAGIQPTDEPGQGGDQDVDAGFPDANGNMTYDFGFVPMMSIGSTVFYDADNSGDQDLANPLEYGIAGVTVNLYFDADNNP
ncbi:SdrD B-like domain-containing protein, partial [Neolewinella lacunae]